MRERGYRVEEPAFPIKGERGVEPKHIASAASKSVFEKMDEECMVARDMKVSDESTEVD